MSRFFFHIHGKRTISDTVGAEIGSAKDLCEFMIALATQFAEAESRMSKRHAEWEIEAVDDKGQLAARLEFVSGPQRGKLAS